MRVLMKMAESEYPEHSVEHKGLVVQGFLEGKSDKLHLGMEDLERARAKQFREMIASSGLGDVIRFAAYLEALEA